MSQGKESEGNLMNPHKNNNAESSYALDQGVKTPLVQALAIVIANAHQIPLEQVTPSYVREEIMKAEQLATQRAKAEGKQVVTHEELRRAGERLQAGVLVRKLTP